MTDFEVTYNVNGGPRLGGLHVDEEGGGTITVVSQMKDDWAPTIQLPARDFLAALYWLRKVRDAGTRLAASRTKSPRHAPTVTVGGTRYVESPDGLKPEDPLGQGGKTLTRVLTYQIAETPVNGVLWLGGNWLYLETMLDVSWGQMPLIYGFEEEALMSSLGYLAAIQAATAAGALDVDPQKMLADLLGESS